MHRTCHSGGNSDNITEDTVDLAVRTSSCLTATYNGYAHVTRKTSFESLSFYCTEFHAAISTNKKTLLRIENRFK